MEINILKTPTRTSGRQPVRFLPPVQFFPYFANRLQRQINSLLNYSSLDIVECQLLYTSIFIGLRPGFAVNERVSAVFEITKQQLKWRL